MKRRTIILLSSLIGFFLLSGCEKNFEELNSNPNAPDFTNPDYLFTYSVVKGMGSYNTNTGVKVWGLMDWEMYLATLGGKESGKEYEMTDSKNDLWRELYVDALSNVYEVVKLTKNNPSLVNKYAIARIWKVYLFQQITDLWGSIPYSKALQGVDYGNFAPAYDSQKDIYYALANELKESEALLDGGKTTFNAGSDPIYDGNVTRWKAFANSLYLRLAIRIRFTDAAKAQEMVNDLSGKILISSNSESAVFRHTSDFKNSLYDVYNNHQSDSKIYPSKFLIDLMNSMNDPRLKELFEPTIESQVIGIPEYAGVPSLVPSGSTVWNSYDLQHGSDVSRISSRVLRYDFPSALLSYAEVCFLQAEAAQLGWISGSAQTYYEKGIRAGLESYNSTLITQTDITNYLSTVPPVSTENIITQKWLSYAFLNAYEPYSEYRRTGYPSFKKYDGTLINTTSFPNRFTYPTNEATLNSANYNAAVSAQGADNIFTKIWWDSNSK